MPVLEETMQCLGRDAVAATGVLAQCSAEVRNKVLKDAARGIRVASAKILEANRADVASATKRGLSAAMLDRLQLDEARVEAMASSVEAVADLPDPVGRVLAEWTRPNGLVIQRRSVPLGVIGIIYESRPNVTADAAALCLKSANAVILRGGSESVHSARAIHACFVLALAHAGLPTEAVQMIPTTDRKAVGYLLREMRDFIDVIVPRGGRRLIERVQADARVPVIGHLEGLCHVFVHASANPAMAHAIVFNSKLRRTGICGAAESLLIDSNCDRALVREILGALLDGGCEVRGEPLHCRIDKRVTPIKPADDDSEYLDAIISVRAVPGVDGAIAHISIHGSGHTDCIVAEDAAAADVFLDRVDSAIVLHNASTQFADGGEFGMGAEIGIATGKIHARGPVGVEQLTSYKYVVRGSGQVRA